MKFDKSSVSITPEILKRKLGGELFVPVTIASSVFADADIVKAGTPINADGEVATDSEGSSDAVGILLNDVVKANPNGSLIKAFAVVNVANCPKVSGSSVITNAVKAALPNIIFE